ncbi:MAG TPA: hypothetical protein VFP68_00435 [Burkholderiaceae bacterium]|nr:hypothetical protein [Burkholderiaceae bacterium]
MDGVSVAAPSTQGHYVTVLRAFVKVLLEKEQGDSLKSFLTRWELAKGREKGPAPHDEPDAETQLDGWLQHLKGGGKQQRRAALTLQSSLEFLLESLKQEGNADLTQGEEAQRLLLDASRLRKLLPSHELELIRSVETRTTHPELVLMSCALLRDGHGGLTGWLAMHKDGRAGLARELLEQRLALSGRKLLPPIEKLQTAAGVMPKLRVRCQRHEVTGEGPRGLGPSASRPGEAEPSGRQAAPPEPAMTPPEALQWFKNRKDDARRIDAIYARYSSGSADQVRDRTRMMRALMRRLLEEDSGATLKEFVERFSSEDDEECRKARELVSAVAGTHSKRPELAERALFRALDELRVLEAGHPEVLNDEFSVLQKAGTPAVYVLPPDDRALVSSMQGNLGRKSAAINFAVALLEKGIGGLSEWISMTRGGRYEEAETLLQEYVASGLTRRVRDFILTATNELRAGTTSAGPTEMEHRSDTRKRARSEEKPDDGGETLTDVSRVSRRARSARNPDPASRGKWGFAAMAPVPEETMSFDEAATWHRNRLEDDALIDQVLSERLKVLGVSPTARGYAGRGLRRFANALADADKADSLNAFLTRIQEMQGDVEQGAVDEVSRFLVGRDGDTYGRAEVSRFKLALKTLRDMPVEEREAKRASALTPPSTSVDPVRLRKALPRQELSLIERVERSHTYPALVRFSSTLLLEGHGGLQGWLAMYKDGREDLARKLLVEKLRAPGPGGLAAIDTLQGIAGVDPGLRIRIQGTNSYVAALGVDADSSNDNVGVARNTQSSQLLGASRVQRTMSRAEAVQWFQNRKDDAILIDGGYVGRLEGDSESGARMLRRFMKKLLERDPGATLRDFLHRLGSDDSIEDIAHELRFFSDNSWGPQRVTETMMALKHGIVDPGLEDMPVDLFSRSGTLPRDLLPPDDKVLMTLLDDAARRRTERGKPVNLSHTSAATRFAIALLDRGIGGLSEWLWMQRQDAPPQEKAEAKNLVESFLSDPSVRVAARGMLFVALRQLQEMRGVCRSCTISRNIGASSSTAIATRQKRQRGEGTLAGVAIDSAQPAAGINDGLRWDLDMARVPRRLRTRREAVVDRRGDDVERVQAVPDEAQALNTAVKEEFPDAHLPQARGPIYVETDLDQGRTAFYREVELCDLCGDLAEWRLHLNPKDATMVRHRPAPISENDHKFPLRDPADPLGRVHPRYAGPDGKCDPKVRIRNVRLAQGFRGYFRQLAKTDARLRVDPGELPSLFGRLEEDARLELDRLIHERSAPARSKPRLLQKTDVMAHEQSLVGQYGLFVPRPSLESELPTFSNGRILGFYMGALVDNDEALARTVSDHPDYEHYAIDANAPRGRITYSGKGATNSLAFANTALKAGVPEAAYDTGRINAVFIEFSVGLFDHQGKPSRESVVAMVALDNLFDDNRDEVQVLVDYGDAFLEHFSGESGTENASSPRAIKPDPESDIAS